LAELDDLERELLGAADVWFDAKLHRKLQRLIEIARIGQRALVELADLRHAPVGVNDGGNGVEPGDADHIFHHPV
jgi:hypothetical protein